MKRSIELEITCSSWKNLQSVVGDLGFIFQGEINVIRSESDQALGKILSLFGSPIHPKSNFIKSYAKIALWLIRLVKLNGITETLQKTIKSRRILFTLDLNSGDDNLLHNDRNLVKNSQVDSPIIFMNRNYHFEFMNISLLQENRIKLLKNLQHFDIIVHSLEIISGEFISTNSTQDHISIYTDSQKSNDISDRSFFRFVEVEECAISGNLLLKSNLRARLEDFCAGASFGFERNAYDYTIPGETKVIGVFVPFTESYFHRFNNSFLALFEDVIIRSDLPIYFSWQWSDFRDLIVSVFPGRTLFWLKREETYAFEGLLIPCYSGFPESTDWSEIDHLNQHFATLSVRCLSYLNTLEVATVPREKIYVDRTRDSLRPLVNSNQLKRSLDALGFTVILPGEMLLHDQIRTFSNAKVIVATSGAALINLIYCKPKTLLIHIYGSDEYSTTWQLLCEALSIDYLFIPTKRIYGLRYLIDRGSSRISKRNVRKIVQLVQASNELSVPTT